MSGAGEAAVPPPVLWAQRRGEVFLTLSVEVAEPEVQIEKRAVKFRGVSRPDGRPLELTVDLYAEVDPERSAHANRGRCIEIVLRKADREAPYWPHLTTDKRKPHWLKVDFNRWRDEEDSADEGGAGAGPGGPGDYDIEEMLRSMGGGAGGGGLGAGGDPAKPSFEDLGADSDDEDLPDLE